MKTQRTANFLKLLEAEAATQSSLQKHWILPRCLVPVTQIVGNYPWQSLLLLSALSAAIAEWVI